MKIRLWKLGSLEHKIFPTERAILTLKKMLNGLDPTKDNDLIYGPDLNVEIVELDGGVNVITPDFTFSKENIQKIEDFIKELVKEKNAKVSSDHNS